MKKLLTVVVLCTGLSFMAQAQDTTARVTRQDTTEHQAKSLDKAVKEKVGPNGETVYKTKDNRYYWIDQDGTKHYATKKELKSAKTKQY